MTAAHVIQGEFIKLKRSLVWLLVLAPPAMLAVMIPAALLSGNGPDEWSTLVMSGGAIWAYLLMPLTMTALTALLAQIEHQSRGWTYVLALPTPKLAVFAAKALVCAALMALISAGVFAAILIGGTLADSLGGDRLAGEPPLSFMASLLARMWLAAMLALAIQFAVAHATANFAVPIIVGIGGTFVAVVATSSGAGVYFPWLLPVNMLASEPPRAAQALVTGAAGGVIVFAGACLWLARRDWR